jgi:hypothetical protein
MIRNFLFKQVRESAFLNFITSGLPIGVSENSRTVVRDQGYRFEVSVQDRETLIKKMMGNV